MPYLLPFSCGLIYGIVFRIVHKPCALIDPLESMGLEIGLVYDIKAKIIAQLEKIGMIGIVRSTDSVDIMLLHQKNILKHRPPGAISSVLFSICNSTFRSAFLYISSKDTSCDTSNNETSGTSYISTSLNIPESHHIS